SPLFLFISAPFYKPYSPATSLHTGVVPPLGGAVYEPQRADCVAGHVGLELRNVDANYPFERSHRFAGIQPNSGFGDYSRLSCGVGDTQLGRGMPQRRYCIRKILIVAEVLQPSRGAAAVVGCGMLAAGGERSACARRSLECRAHRLPADQ